VGMRIRDDSGRGQKIIRFPQGVPMTIEITK
jgi:hypothetical protein